MRITIKGGVWKNTEDEILKAAVMKYGLNQWSRISSLLVRKSAKQCKARWYEWLDPSIKKTEWTREEDEKLLHLAKIMPTQWRTIAPIVGRTPQQCLERYEKLLSQAASGESLDPRDDPRRLRPGEIDPNPESKPARPDAVDMDEDEKEMLAEARARLANTRGKKAKRMAREKQLEEAKRLAILQKKRELRAAGIEVGTRSKQRRAIDYNAEVAFERRAPAGFYDTGAEAEKTRELQREFRPMSYTDAMGDTKKRAAIERVLLEQDKAKERKMMETDRAGELQRALRASAAGTAGEAVMGRRRKMMMPAPQMSEAELQHIAKMAAEGAIDAEALEGAGGDATRALVGSYAETPARLMTGREMRTPRAQGAGGGDAVMEAARDLARLEQAGTPLLGGEGPAVREGDFGGITPARRSVATPNPLATPAGAGAGPGATPFATPGATPGATPYRDQFGLNQPGASALSTPAADAARRGDLRGALAALPKPANQYSVELPAMEDEGEVREPAREMDAAELDRMAAQRAEEERLAELRRRPKAAQRGLPAPASTAAVQACGAPRGLEAAAEALAEEMRALIDHDAAKYPPEGESKKGKKSAKRRREAAAAVPDLPRYAEAELQQAELVVEEELQELLAAVRAGGEDVEEAVHAGWEAAAGEFLWLPSQGAYGRAATASNADKLDSMREAFRRLRGVMEREAKTAAKLAQKLDVQTRGLQDRHGKLAGEVDAAYTECARARLQLSLFRALREQEEWAAPTRVKAMEALVERLRAREEALQKEYKELIDKREDAKRAAEAAA